MLQIFLRDLCEYLRDLCVEKLYFSFIKKLILNHNHLLRQFPRRCLQRVIINTGIEGRCDDVDLVVSYLVESIEDVLNQSSVNIKQIQRNLL